MKFWKFEYPGEIEASKCIREMRLPPKELPYSGLKNTYDHPFKSMVVGDAVFLATLSGEEARFFAVGRVLDKSGLNAIPRIQWVENTFGKFPDASGGLPNWRTKTSFEISSAPAQRYGLLEIVNYYIKTDANPFAPPNAAIGPVSSKP